MATAKKIAAKKAPARKVAAKKAPVAVKRPYKRKPKDVAQDINQAIAAVASHIGLTEANTPPVAPDAPGQPFSPQLLGTEIFDLRDQDFVGRFHLVAWLSALGYVFATNPSIAATEHPMNYGGALGLRLQHDNRLLFPVFDNAEIDNSRRVSHLEHLDVQHTLTLSDPGPVIPDTIEQNGRTYLRVN